MGYKGANYLKIAVDTWETMISPILKEHLMRFNFSNRVEQKGRLSNSFQFHNIIKENMIRTAADSCKLPFYREMKTLPSIFDPQRQAWILPCIPELVDLLQQGKYKHIPSVIDKNNEEIVVHTSSFSESNPSTSSTSSNSSSTLSYPLHSKQIKLCDLCTGKGGDLWKWIRNDVKYVFGIDNEFGLLVGQSDSAIKRLALIRNQEKDALNCNIAFAEMDARCKISDYLKGKNLLYEFDIVSCFFALHYFFGSVYDFNNFMVNVDEMLSFGGYFIGMVMNGNLLFDLLKLNGGVYEIKEKNGDVLCKIQQKYGSNESDVFGLEIEVDIKDSILEDYLETSEKKSIKKEYLVDLSKLQKICSGYGLDLIEYTSLHDLVSRSNHVHNPQKYNVKLSDAEKEFTSLFTCFTFGKTSNSLWKKNNNDSFNYETLWMKNWKQFQQQQLDNNSCDRIAYKSTSAPPLFQIIPSKNPKNPKRSRISEDGNGEPQQLTPPVFSFVKPKETNEEEKIDQTKKTKVI